MKIYNWNAEEAIAPEGVVSNEIEVSFRIQGVNNQALWVDLFAAGKGILEGNVVNVFSYVMNLGMFLYGLFKKTR